MFIRQHCLFARHSTISRLCVAPSFKCKSIPFNGCKPKNEIRKKNVYIPSAFSVPSTVGIWAHSSQDHYAIGTIIPFYRCGNWGMEFKDFLKGLQIVAFDRARIQTHAASAWGALRPVVATLPRPQPICSVLKTPNLPPLHCILRGPAEAALSSEEPARRLPRNAEEAEPLSIFLEYNLF